MTSDELTVGVNTWFIAVNSPETYYHLPGGDEGRIRRTLAQAGFQPLSDSEHQQQGRQRVTVKMFTADRSLDGWVPSHRAR